MLVVVFNAGSLSYASAALSVLRDYFGFFKIKYEIVEDLKGFNTKKAHPSWMKLLTHRMFPGHDFILNWDLDLLPMRSAPSIETILDKAKLNMAIDSTLIAGQDKFNENFKYNGGLVGVPASMAEWIAAIYDKHAPGEYPSYEQYYLNDAIVADKVDVHRIPDEFNTLFPQCSAGKILWDNAVIKHYGCSILSSLDMVTLTDIHAENYFKGAMYV